MRTGKIGFLLLLGLLLSFFSCTSNKKTDAKKHYEANWESLKQHQTPDWFMDGKFGIYFHWGVYSVPAFGTEWYPRHMYIENKQGWGKEVRPHHLKKYGADFHYHDFIPQFTAEHFNATEWAKLFAASGAKWAGPVSEHCDNFSMWDSEVNPWNAAKMGPKRDVVGELEKAIKNEGLKFTTTFHHSWNWAWYDTWSGFIDTSTAELRDFYGETVFPGTFDSLKHAPEKFGPSKTFVEDWKSKIFEVVDKYEPDMLWFDSRLNIIPETARLEVVSHYYNRGIEWNKPVVLNYKNEDLAKGAGVIDIERGRLDQKVEYAWLTDDSWDWSGWNYKENHEYKSANHILDGLIDIVSKNGCLLLNFGPKADGTIPEEIRTGLLQMGKWLGEYGEAIYKTRPFVTYGEGPTKLKKNHFGGVNDQGITYTSDDFRFTTNSKKLYILQLGIPESKQDFILESFARDSIAENIKLNSMELLGSNEKIEWIQKDDGLHLRAPQDVRNTIALVYKAVVE